MNEKIEILNQINSFKNNIINGNYNQHFLNNNKASLYKVDYNSKKSNNIINEPRNTTAPNNSNKRQKGYTHLKITAKNKDINSPIDLYKKENIYLINVFSQKKLSKSLSKAMTKKVSKNKSIKNVKRIKYIKRINSSNNIQDVDNNAIDKFTHKYLEGNK